MAEKKYVWDLKDVFAGDTYESMLKKIEASTKFIENSRKKLSKDIAPNELLKIINVLEETGVLFSRLSCYYSLKTAENTKDEDALAKLSYLSVLGSDFSTRTLFFELWFINLDDKAAARLINSKELAKYKYYLENTRAFKPYTKSEEVEKILSLKDVTGGDAFSSLYELHINSYKFAYKGKKDLTQDQLMTHYTSPDPKIREEVYKIIYSKYKEDSVFLSEIYKNIVLDWYNEVVKIRGYASPISARNMSNRIDDEAVKTFLGVVRKNAAIFAEYFKVKQEILKKRGQKFKFSRYHIYAPYLMKEKKYSYDESKKIVLETFNNFDPRFYAAAKKIFDEKHVHSHPAQGKRGGAFCMMIDNKVTPYVMLNHTGKFRDVSTMMHELGHAVHDIFSSKQINLLAHAKIPLAETASVFAETLLIKRFMAESKNKEEKIGLLVQVLDSHYQSIPRQAYFAVFENWAHEHIKDGVTKKEIDAFYRSLLVEQFGDMEIPELFDHEWNYMPHIHFTPFYVYSYAWGNLLVLSLYAMYKEQGKKFVDKYIDFLSAGASKSTTDIMLDIGADPRKEEFWQKGFDIIRQDLEELKRLVQDK
ncbi:MAG: M3 family oligoendopeptidase [Candidatus Nanoarchaeia archaeon]